MPPEGLGKRLSRGQAAGMSGPPSPPVPPSIFSPVRRHAQRARMRQLQRAPGAPRYVMDDMVEDVLDRLAFLRHEPARALVVGDWTGTLADTLAQRGASVLRLDPVPDDGEGPVDEERPLDVGGFDFIASLGTLDTVNDLPGALVHLRGALADDGLMIASFMGAGSLPLVRDIMLAADADRPGPRIHPQVDVRAAAQLLQRCGFADPVVDSRALNVRFSAFKVLLGDLRAQGLGNCLANPGPPLGKRAYSRAASAFESAADTEGRVVESFELLTLSGWAKPLRPPKF